jgi:hypothetical protein
MSAWAIRDSLPWPINKAPRGIGASLWVLAGLVCIGCQTSFRCETVVSADGKVERAIYQPNERTPNAAKDPKKWTQVKRAPTPRELDNVGWPSSLKEIDSIPARMGQPYFAAWGTFGSPREIPDHVDFMDEKLPDGPHARLVRDWTVTDCVFVTEYRWRETLTDIVTWDGMHQARKELLDLVIVLWHDGFVDSVGRDYDDADFVHWLETEGRTWAGEMLDLVFIHCVVHKGPDAHASLPRASQERRSIGGTEESARMDHAAKERPAGRAGAPPRALSFRPFMEKSACASVRG